VPALHESFGLPVRQTQAAIVIAVTVLSWATGLLAEPLPTLAFFLLVVLFDISSPTVAFSGFASQAWWLVLSGSVIGLAIKSSGLGHRISAAIFAGARPTYHSYLIRVAILSVGLAFLMPSTTGRIMLLTPIILALAEQLGYRLGSNGHTGLVLAVATTSYMPPTAILPANLPNSVLLGAAESIYGIKLSYGEYLLMHFPVLGILKTILIIWCIGRLFPSEPPMKSDARKNQPPMSGQERRLLLVLSVAVGLFSTDFLHGISPAWVSLGAAICCLWPGFGLLSTKSFEESMHVVPLVYVAGFLGLGAVVADSGMGVSIGRWLIQHLTTTDGSQVGMLGAIVLIGGCIGLVTTLPSLPAVITPLAAEFAKASGLPLFTILMLQVPVYSTVLLPYQCPPMLIAMTMGGVSIKHGTKLCLVIAAISTVVLLPLDGLWWRLLGYI